MMRNSKQSSFAFQRDVGRCKTLEKNCRTHRGAAAVKFYLTVGADGNSRNRVKMCQHLRASSSDEKEWYRGRFKFQILTLSSL